MINAWVQRWKETTGEADRGDTLVELLIAMVILAITVAALLGALIASTAGSVEHRSLTSLDSILKSFADSAKYEIQMQPLVSAPNGSGPQFVECATTNTYQILSTPTPSSGPAGTSTTVFGTGLTPGATVHSVMVGSAQAAVTSTYPTTVDANGNVTLTFNVPAGLTAGTSYPVTVTDSANRTETSSGGFSVTGGAPSTILSSLSDYSLSISSVQWWNGAAFVPGNGCQPSDKTGIQLLTVTAVAQDHTTSSLSFAVSNPGTTAPVLVSAQGYFVAGTPANFQIVYYGYPAPVFVSSGTLPPGLSLSTSGLLNGTPTSGGSYTFTITAKNANNQTSEQFTAVVYQKPAITSASSVGFKTGSGGTFTVTTTGYPTPSITNGFAGCNASNLPGSITLTDNGNGTATIKATNAAPQGTYTICLNATNTNPDPGNPQTNSATQTFKLYIGTIPAITSAPSAGFKAGTTSTFTVTTTGTLPMSITNGFGTCNASNLPGSITLTDNGNGTATIKATNTAPQGTYTICLNATNPIGTGTQTFTLTIGTVPVITSANNVGFRTGTGGTFTVTTTGFPAPAVTNGYFGCNASNLPGSITLTDNGNGTATIKATNTSPQGTYTICLNATNPIGTGTQTFTLTIGTVPVITSANSADFAPGLGGSFTVTTSGSPAPAITNGFVGCNASNLPGSITLTDNGNGTATIKATAGAPQGSYTICLNATNPIGTGTQKFTLGIGQPPTITGPTSVTFTSGTNSSYSYTTTGAPTLAITSGALPASGRITFNTTTGVLSGNPRRQDRGTYVITVTATNAYGSASITVTVSVS